MNYYLKLEDITPVIKRNDLLNTRNHKLVSVLPSIYKTFEKLLQR